MSSAERILEYISKKVTQQEEFLKKYPEYDGRGLLIAVIDISHADASLPGLQKTTEGLPKIIDYFIFGEDEKVESSVIKEVDAENTLIGLSGRKLKIPLTWKNPSGKWHLGKKYFKDLFCKKDSDKDCKKSMQENLNISESNKDKTIIVDCIVWFDGEKWRACINTTGDDDLENAKVLTNYSDEHEFGFIAEKISYCIKIQNDGNLLELFIANDDHGGTVARIVAANSPGEPEKNGLAPGAQIVSMKVDGLPSLEKAVRLISLLLTLQISFIAFKMY
uniref:Peptidase S8/S53 domain-containing protein n=1 Tax=Panagrolaimus sp. ES5 TaxID=591445 RepID=A0AC34G2D2_9BILA